MKRIERRHGERGHMLLVVVFIATAIAGLAAISSGRVVSESRHQQVLENETRAFNSAYAQLHMALNVVNTSAYTETNQNVALRDAMDGLFGGTVAEVGLDPVGKVTGQGRKTGGTTTVGTIEPTGPNGGETSGYAKDAEDQGLNTAWLDDASDPAYGFLQGTSVRVYRGRDYIRRMQRLRGLEVEAADPFGESDAYFILEAAGRSGDTIRLVSALVRETQPFSSFVFFQNRATLGVSGAPRGMIHANDTLSFYFPNGSYVDPVSSVNGFDYVAGATPTNTNLRDANPAATEITLEDADFDQLRSKAKLYTGEPGLDAEIQLLSNGKVKVRPHTPPRYDMVEKTRTYQQYTGTQQVTVTERQQVQVGTQQVTVQVQVLDGYRTETTWVWQNVKVGETTETRYRDVQVQVGTQSVTKTRQEPVYEWQTVTKTRQVKVWVPYNGGDAGGGTSVGGGAGGELGEWVWQTETYEAQEQVQVGTRTVEYTVQEPVYKTVQEPYTVTTPIYEKQQVQKTQQVPVYKTVDEVRTEPVYEWQDVQVTKTVNVYETVTETYVQEEYFPPTYFGNEFLDLGDAGGTIYIDGRITDLHGDLQGRLTIVGNEKVRITGNVRYVDSRGREAMENGSDYTKPYERNSKYEGNSVLGVIARDDIVFTRTMPSSAEVNATLLSVNGRVGIDGFWADADGELHRDSSRNRRKYLTPEQQARERAYDRRGSTRTRRFTKNSLRRIGGIISNNRIMETYVTSDKSGYARVSAGFKRGSSKFDINMLFNPPPNFVEVPRPVVTAFVPVLLVRDNDS